MGAGRRTETYTGSIPPTLGPLPSFRNLPPENLASVIFFCSQATHQECITELIFGLPLVHINYVKNVQPGMPLFLFNCSDKKLHGIFEAMSKGGLCINPYSWTAHGGKTPFPAQVLVRVRQLCQPLTESEFKEAIMKNYYSDTHFLFELDHVQTDSLIAKFVKKTPRSTDLPARPLPSTVPNGRKKDARLQQEDEEDDGWIKPKKSTKSDDLWNRSKAYQSPSQRSTSLQLQDVNATPEQWDNDLNDVEKSAGMKSFSVNLMAEMDEKDVLATEESSSYTSHAQSNLGPIVEQVKTEQEQEQEQEQERTLAILEKLQQIKQSKGKSILQEKTEVPATLPIKLAEDESSEWEKLARERCLQEQIMLREDREKLRESLQAMDSSVAKSVQKNLELCAAAIAQMRQDKLELKRVLAEASADLESLREIERLRERNAMLEHSQVQMGSELQSLKLEVARISQRLELLSQGVGLGSESLLTGDSCRETKLELQQSNVYLLGGHDGKSWLDTVDIFCPGTNSLRPVTPMLAPRFCAAASVLMGQLYTFGGGNGLSYFETAEMYNDQTNEWFACASMSLQRGSLGGATVGDRIFALGGGNGNVSFSEVECYDAHLGIWISSTSMLYKRFGVAAAELDGALYAIGGYDNTYLKSVERFDPREALWTVVAPMNRKRGSLSAAVLGGKIYAIGGFDGSELLNSVEFYEPRRNCWLEMEQPMHTRRAYGAVAVVGDSLYMIGGLNGDIYLESVECYHEKTGWESVPCDVLGKRCFHAVAVLE